MVRLRPSNGVDRLTGSSRYRLLAEMWCTADGASILYGAAAMEFATTLRALSIFGRAEGVALPDVLRVVEALLAEDTHATPGVRAFARRHVEDAYKRVD